MPVFIYLHHFLSDFCFEKLNDGLSQGWVKRTLFPKGDFFSLVTFYPPLRERETCVNLWLRRLRWRHNLVVFVILRLLQQSKAVSTCLIGNFSPDWGKMKRAFVCTLSFPIVVRKKGGKNKLLSFLLFYTVVATTIPKEKRQCPHGERELVLETDLLLFTMSKSSGRIPQPVRKRSQ